MSNNPLAASYFQQLQTALVQAELAEPVLIIDRDRLDANIDRLKTHLPQGMAYRIVAKSLPSAPLIEYVASRAGTDRLMSFNTNMVEQLVALMPEADQLLGKPIPIVAVQRIFKRADAAGASALQQKVQWLIDTPERIEQYEAFAASSGLSLRINLEIDVGLHRGGMEPGDALATALQRISNSNHLELSGLMGYEPHLTKLPNLAGWPKRAKKGAADRFREALAQVSSILGEGHSDAMIRNMAGSPTFGLYTDTGLANEIAAGSALVKPSDFDLPILKDFLPASFIATPAIKVSNGVRLPGLEYANRALGKPKSGKTVFLHGGYWKADPVYPGGLKYSNLFGRSSNQEMLVAPKNSSLKVDDFVFLRPTQSEAVFLQFPKIAVFSGGEIVDQWQPLPVTA
ncbi:putative amino acid aldolase or racemase [gamma proteobacterium HIMB55]|nr:putative amino acid aldolase or racemase [gamma proteobacterium HIMB55]